MATRNASGGSPAAVEQYSSQTFDNPAAPGFAVFALARDAELAPGSQLVFLGVFAGKSRQHDVAPAARARLTELGWSGDDSRGTALVSVRPGGVRTTPSLTFPDADTEAAPEPAPGGKQSRGGRATGTES